MKVIPEAELCGQVAHTSALRFPIKVVRLITGLEIGGAELGLRDNIRYFDRTKFSFVVICLYNNGSVGRQIEKLGIPVIDMRMRSFGDPAGLLRLCRTLKELKPDVLHTHLFRANVWGRLMGAMLSIPVVISSEHSLTQNDLAGYRRTRLLSIIDYCTALCCDRIIAVSEATKKRLLEAGIPERKIEVILNAVETELYEREENGDSIRKEFGLENAKVVTIVARLVGFKNHALLIEAFAGVVQRLPEAKLLIVGSGPLENELRARAEAAIPGSAIFAGNRDDIPAVMAASDIVLLSSNNEPFGKVLVEAMASGKPVIGTAVDGIPEVIGTESGILVPRGDAPALADAIFRLLSDAELAAAMGQAGRKRAREKFNVRGAVRRMEELYIELLESANG